jgi:Xaa-Pro aminopeptidase
MVEATQEAAANPKLDKMRELMAA